MATVSAASATSIERIDHGGAGIQGYYNYINQNLNWPYLHNFKPAPVYNSQIIRTFWIDQNDPTL